MKTVRVVIARPGQEPLVEHIIDSLESFQEVVGGFIERLPGISRTFDFLANEYGRDKGLPFNRMVGPYPILGTLVVTKHDAQGETVSLTEDDSKLILHYLSQWSVSQ